MRPTAFISTGSKLLDTAIGCPGIPQSKITLLIGEEDSGKTTTATHIMASCQQIEGKVFFLDAEGTYDEDRAKRIGLNVDDVEFVEYPSAEDGFRFITKLAIKPCKVPRLIVWDTYSASGLDTERGDKKTGPTLEGSVAGHARLVSRALRGLNNPMHDGNITLLTILQRKTNIQSWGFSGGVDYLARRAWTMSSLLGIEAKRIKRLEKGKVPYGSRSRFQVFRNKMSPPFKTCELDIYFEDGFHESMTNVLEDYLEAAIAGKLVVQKGAWFGYNDEHFLRKGWAEFLAKHPDLAAKLGITDLANDVEDEPSDDDEEGGDVEERIIAETEEKASPQPAASDGDC